MNFWSIRGLRFVLIVLILCICISPVFAETVYTKTGFFHIDVTWKDSINGYEIKVFCDGPATASLNTSKTTEDEFIIVHQDSTDMERDQPGSIVSVWRNAEHSIRIGIQEATSKKFNIIIREQNPRYYLYMAGQNAKSVSVKFIRKSTEIRPM